MNANTASTQVFTVKNIVAVQPVKQTTNSAPVIQFTSILTSK